MTRLYTTASVARIFGVTDRQVRNWCADGRISYTLTPGGQYRFTQADVDEVLELHRRERVDRDAVAAALAEPNPLADPTVARVVRIDPRRVAGRRRRAG